MESTKKREKLLRLYRPKYRESKAGRKGYEKEKRGEAKVGGGTNFSTRSLEAGRNRRNLERPMTIIRNHLRPYRWRTIELDGTVSMG